MSTQIVLENCPECNAEVSKQHTTDCKAELCKVCGLSPKRSEGCHCKSSYEPMTTIWHGQIFSRSDNFMSFVAWPLLFKIREAVNVELEALRQAKVVGKGTETGVVVDLSQDIRNMISLLPSELAEFCCVSEFTFGNNHSANNEIIVSVLSLKNTYKKCDRCFRYNGSVGVHDYWPTFNLCKRCVDVLFELRWPPFIVNGEECYVCTGEAEWHQLKAK